MSLPWVRASIHRRSSCSALGGRWRDVTAKPGAPLPPPSPQGARGGTPRVPRPQRPGCVLHAERETDVRSSGARIGRSFGGGAGDPLIRPNTARCKCLESGSPMEAGLGHSVGDRRRCGRGGRRDRRLRSYLFARYALAKSQPLTVRAARIQSPPQTTVGMPVSSDSTYASERSSGRSRTSPLMSSTA